MPKEPVRYCSVRWFLGRLEDLGGGAVLDELAEVHEAGEIGDAGGLLHVVGDDEDGHFVLEGEDHVLDFRRGDRVEGGGGLVEEEDFRLGGQGAGDAQALLLAAGELDGRLVQPVFDFVPEGGGRGAPSRPARR